MRTQSSQFDLSPASLLRGPAAATAQAPSGNRILGLDFTKGALVLIMVGYHWTNYFVQVSDFRYVRFLTPSFIFITGFLIAQVYLPRSAGGSRIPARLAVRGGKLLALTLVLNLALRLAPDSAGSRALGLSFGGLMAAFFMGVAPVSFSILVPISYLLLCSAGLFVVRRLCRPIFHLVAVVLVLLALVCEWAGLGNGYLEALSIGLLGVSVGHIALPEIDRVLRNPAVLVVAYGLYAFAIALWNANYLLQIAGVCLNLAVLYWLGERGSATRPVRLLARLGGYSLFAYIAQIFILQVLRRVLPALAPDAWVPAMALLLGCLGTLLVVEILDWTRLRVAPVNRLYSAVFS